MSGLTPVTPEFIDSVRGTDFADDPVVQTSEPASSGGVEIVVRPTVDLSGGISPGVIVFAGVASAAIGFAAVVAIARLFACRSVD